MMQEVMYGAGFTALFALATVLLCVAAYDDIKTRHVHDALTNSIVTIGALHLALVCVARESPLSNVAGAVAVSLPMLVSAFVKDGSVGGADIRICFGLGMLVGFDAMVRIFMVSAFAAVAFAVMYCAVKRQRLSAAFSLPYVPFLVAGVAVEWITTLKGLIT